MITLTILTSLHAIVTIAMCGLIWFVQVVHYPLFHRAGTDGFVAYEFEHQRRTTWVVAPLMMEFVDNLKSSILSTMLKNRLFRPLRKKGRT